MAELTVQEALEQALQLHQNGDLQAAENIYRQILSIDPQNCDALHLLGNIAMSVGQLQVAANLIQRAIQIAPQSAAFYQSLGSLFALAGDVDNSHRAFLRAAELNPTAANYATAARSLGMTRPFDSIELMKKAIEIGPATFDLYLTLGATQWLTYQMEDAYKVFRHGLELYPGNVLLHSNLLHTMEHVIPFDPQAIFEEHVRWGELNADPQAAKIKPLTNDRNPDRRLKIAYCSSVFGPGAVGNFAEPLLQSHDHSRFEIFVYNDGNPEDPITKRFIPLADHWFNLHGLSNDDVAEKIRNDGIDIVVEICGHVAGNRLLALAQKPAPVQVSYLAYPSTTGVKQIDYRLTDALADPVGMTEKYYVEKLWRLPRSAYCWRPPPGTPEVNELPALKNGYITFGSNNRISKMSPEVYELWAAILLATPGSRLIIKCVHAPKPEVRDQVLEKFAALGVTADRIDLYDYTTLNEYLNIFAKIDIVLDAFPYSGHTTNCESVWMGCPIVTLAGTTHNGRMGVDVLTQVGLPELIGQTHEEYRKIAVDLANDLPRLKKLRATLRQKTQDSPMCDKVGITRNIENAYREMWKIWCTS